ncbi:MAG: hypothetical protein ACE5H1_11630 [Thermodesulfobacteriota bacterium]
MKSEKEIRSMLNDIISTYETGYRTGDLDTEAEKWGQIEILRWVLNE